MMSVSGFFEMRFGQVILYVNPRRKGRKGTIDVHRFTAPAARMARDMKSDQILRFKARPEGESSSPRVISFSLRIWDGVAYSSNECTPRTLLNVYNHRPPPGDKPLRCPNTLPQPRAIR